MINDDGEIFVPPVVAEMSEMAAFMCMSWDGTEGAIVHRKHLFVPAQWLRRERPQHADIIDKIVSKTTEARAGATS